MKPHNQYNAELAAKYKDIAALSNPAQRLACESWLAAIGRFEGVGGDSVLDLGCGTGESTRLLAEMGARRIVGIDYSGEMLKEAVRQDPGCLIEYRQADCSKPLDHDLR